MKKLIAAAMFILMIPFSANATELIINGGFESGLSGWSSSGADLMTVYSGYGVSGSAAALGFDNTGFATLSQTISTTPGATYDFSFYSLAYQIAGNQLGYSFSGFDNAVFVQTTTSYLQTLDSFLATAPTTSVELYFATDPSTGYWCIDNVSVQQETAPVPEPGTFVLFGAGMAGLAFLNRRRKNQNV